MYHYNFVDEKEKLPKLSRKEKDKQLSDSSDEEDSQVSYCLLFLLIL